MQKSPPSEPLSALPVNNTSKPPKKYVRATIYLPLPIHEALRKAAFERRRSLHELLQEGVDVAVERYCGKSRQELMTHSDV
jgi:hypothetical protein